MSSEIDPKEMRTKRNKKFREILKGFYNLSKGKSDEKCQIKDKFENRDYYIELNQNDFISITDIADLDAGTEITAELTVNGRDEVEKGFPNFSVSSPIFIDKHLFKIRIDEIKNLNEMELSKLRNLEKSYKSMVSQFEVLKEILTDISIKEKDNEFKTILDRILSIDPTNVTRFALGVIELVKHPRYPEFVEKHIEGKNVPLIPIGFEIRTTLKSVMYQ